MARDFEITVSQQRALDLFGLACSGGFTDAKLVLLGAGLTENGVPSGLTPREAKKLSDDELKTAFGVVAPSYETTMRAASIQASRSYVAPTLGDRKRERRARDEQNARLRAAGYTWSREEVQDSISPLRDDWSEAWVLRAPDGREVTVREALAEIGGN